MAALRFFLSAFLVAAPVGLAEAHDGGLPIRSTHFESGRLAVAPGSLGPFTVVQSACASGQCLFSGAGPSFVAPGGDVGPSGPFALKIATLVKAEVVAVDAGAAIKVGSSLLDAVGESATLGAAWSLHADVVLQATAPQGVDKEWTVALQLTSSRYEASEPVILVLRNFEPVPTTTSTSSTTLSPVCGDGAVDATEECDRGADPWKTGSACGEDCAFLSCGDVDGNAKVTAADALFVLRVAVGTRDCDPCLCNADGSATGAPVSVTDALRLLRVSVGSAGAALACPACS